MTEHQTALDPTTPASSTAAEGGHRSTSTLLPDLPKETWEYIELKLWTSFSKKIWFLVIALVTVLGLLATLGVNSWLQSKTDATLQAEQEKFRKYYEELQTKTEDALLIEAIDFHLQMRMVLDVKRYIDMVREFENQVGKEVYTKLHASPILSKLLSPADKFGGSFDTVPDDEIKEALSVIANVSPETLSAAENLLSSGNLVLVPVPGATELERVLKGLNLWSSHIIAMRETLRLTEKLLFTTIKANPDKLIQLYEAKVLPTYNQSMKKRGAKSLVWSGSGENTINSLFPDARVEFKSFIPSYMDTLFNSKEEKK